MKKHGKKILMGVMVLTVLAAVFWWGGNAPSLRGWPEENKYRQTASVKTDMPEPTVPQTEEENVEQTAAPESAPQETAEKEAAEVQERPAGEENRPMTAEEKVEMAARLAQSSTPEITYQPPPKAGEDPSSENSEPDVSQEQTAQMAAKPAGSVRDRYNTDPVPADKPQPMEPQDAVITDKELTCTMSVRCDTILQNMDWLDPEKAELVPKDGILFAEQTVTFYEGESVFNLLLREMKKNKIHMEFENTPLHNSAYIEGIGNLYEFDCGELSGWLYSVNGWFPNYGCSRYQLQEGDRVEWVYTCTLGVDVGGFNAAAEGGQ